MDVERLDRENTINTTNYHLFCYCFLASRPHQHWRTNECCCCYKADWPIAQGTDATIAVGQDRRTLVFAPAPAPAPAPVSATVVVPGFVPAPFDRCGLQSQDPRFAVACALMWALALY